MKEKIINKNLLAVKFAAVTAIMALAATAFLPVIAKAEEEREGTTVASIIFTKGALNLVEVPNADFGINELSLDSKAFAFQGTAPIKVSDARGNGAGWLLTADLSKFTLDAMDALQGAAIEVINPVVKPVGETPNVRPPVIPVDGNNKLILPSAGGIVKVLDAAPNNGRGAWETILDANNTVLSIKPGTAETTPTNSPNLANINWLLTEAP